MNRSHLVFIHVWIRKFACICQVSKAFRMDKSMGMFMLWVYFVKKQSGDPLKTLNLKNIPVASEDNYCSST